LPVPLMMNAAKYAQVGREILINNDWVNLTIGGVPYEQKPPMLFWVAAICFSLFGVSVPAYKISVILISLLGVYSTFRLAKLFYGHEVGMLAATFWITSLGFLHFHNDIHTDTMLAAFVVFSVWQFMTYFSQRKWFHFLLGVIGIGISMLTKGPVGMVIPAFAVGANLFLHKQWRDIFHIRWLLAIPLLALVIAPALAGLFRQFGLEGIKFYFWTNNMGRVTGSYYGDNNDYSFYIHTALYLLLPWSIFMLAGMYNEFRSLIRIKRADISNVEVVNIAAVVFFVAILSVAKQKNPHYLLSVTPFIFIITAKWCTRLFDKTQLNKRARIITYINKVVALLLLGVVPIVSLYFFKEQSLLFWATVILLAVGVFYFIFNAVDLRKQVLMLLLSSSALLLTLNVVLLPNMFEFYSSIHAAELFNSKANENATLNMYKPKARLWDLLFYSGNYGTYLETKEDLECFLPHKGAWIYTTDEGYRELKEMNPDMEVIGVFYKHKNVSSISLNFLNPKTRAATFRTMYLVKLK